MQKASASATEAGLSFEWLGAYIATVSEKTRQAPEVIGTAYNTIIARLHNIKAKGFNAYMPISFYLLSLIHLVHGSMKKALELNSKAF